MDNKGESSASIRSLQERYVDLPLDFPHPFLQFTLKHIVPTYNPTSVTVDFWRSLNGRPQQRWLDPNLDLSSVPYHPFKSYHIGWLREPLVQSRDYTFFSDLEEARALWKGEGKECLFFMEPGGHYFKGVVYLLLIVTSQHHGKQNTSTTPCTSFEARLTCRLTAPKNRYGFLPPPVDMMKVSMTAENEYLFTYSEMSQLYLNTTSSDPALWAYLYYSKN